LDDGREIQTVLLPISLNQARLKVRTGVPRLGEHNDDVLRSLGYSPEEINQLSQANTQLPTPAKPSEKG
jgi:crotonobetainyl-CoA:carnitine CoA-transferase CaiB-like acyl-CoA transferase